jgi:heme/copper-type cytochrome/quinol oxidase subunit 4
MKALMLFNAAILALLTSFAVTLVVVVILYSFHLDAAPRMRSEWRTVSLLTAIFVVLTGIAAATFWGQWRRRPWRWPAQLALILGLAGGGWCMARLLI